MSYFLKHHFDPDFDHLDIKTKALGNEPVDHLNRDYVHNVVDGQVLAELVEVPGHEEGRYDSRFILEQSVFPMGQNTRIDPRNPGLLLATANGYVYYDPNGKIAVKTLLNVRRDVDYATGNITFVGDVVVHGSVRSGFKVKARNILVKGPVEGAVLEASQSIHVEAGVKGDNRAVLRAKGSIKVKFCENAMISAGKNLLVEGSCLHCKLFVGNALAVRNKLIGGETSCRRMVHVRAQLGGGLSTMTSINLGYDPFLMQRLSELETTIDSLKLRRDALDVQTIETSHDVQLRQDLEHRLSVLEKKRILWTEQIAADDLSSCAVIVPGEIRPEVEVSIGQFYQSISDYVYNVRIVLQNDQIHLATPAE
ncbi:FapA family protein [Desulfonatronum parangueonense]